MTKKQKLDECWKNCLSMWRWIAKEVKAGTDADVGDLKVGWLARHGFSNISDNCFFCDYGRTYSECPGKLVDKDFNCEDEDYDYWEEPIAFYNKLVSLNRKRKARPK